MKNNIPGAFLPLSFIFLVIVFSSASCGLFFYEDMRGGIAADGQVQEYDNNSDHLPDQLYSVDEVIDEDTFSITSGETIRMLGINTPEVDRYYYDEAREILEIIIGGKKVMLEKDVTERDRYGRLLRYVYCGSLFVNLEMVKRGYANVYTLPPDVKYTQNLIEAERYARENSLGLWAYPMDKPGIILILNYDADGDDRQNLNGEYLILRNESNSDYNIKGWTIKDSGTNIYEFGRFLFLNGTDITLFTGSGQDGNGYFYWNNDLPIWNNDHDSVFLRDREGLLIEFLRY